MFYLSCWFLPCRVEDGVGVSHLCIKITLLTQNTSPHPLSGQMIVQNTGAYHHWLRLPRAWRNGQKRTQGEYTGRGFRTRSSYWSSTS